MLSQLPGSRSEEVRTGGRAASMPPEKHLGLGSYLPEQTRPPSSIKGSNSGSISGSKRKADDGCSQGLHLQQQKMAKSAAHTHLPLLVGLKVLTHKHKTNSNNNWL